MYVASLTFFSFSRKSWYWRISSGPSWSGDLRKCLANAATARMDPWRVTQMVTDRKKNSGKTPEKQGAEQSASEPNKINASTPYDFSGKNLTPYGGLLPGVTMLEKLGFESLVKETLTSKRIPRVMDVYRFVLSIVLGL